MAHFIQISSIFIFFFFSQIIMNVGLTDKVSSDSSSSPLHIFLSFRGADTRDNIASLVYDALHREGFNVFMDDESIRMGQDIDFAIREAINKSMGAVIIFSRNFATSRWCLKELALILERKKMVGSSYVLQPIYVDGVVPEDVGKQKRWYGEALDMHRKRWNKNVSVWTAALTEVADYRGRILNGKWAKFINEMVEEIREEFFVHLGITVKPRPTWKNYGPDRMYESVKKSVTRGEWVVDAMKSNSFIKAMAIIIPLYLIIRG